MGLDFVHEQSFLSRELSGKTSVIGCNLLESFGDWRNSNINMAHGRVHDQSNEPQRTRNRVRNGGRGKQNSETRGRQSFSHERKPANIEGDPEPGSDRMGTKTDSDESSVKLSVRERVQLLNSHSGPDKDKSRGRSSGKRGWMKKRDQSAPPGSSRTPTPQKAAPVGGSPTRRARSTERPRNALSKDSAVKDENLTGQEKRLTDSLEEPKDIKISRNSAFIRVGRPRSQVDTKTSLPVTPLEVSNKAPPTREPHFNPRSRMRNPRTVRNFARSTSNDSPDDNHVPSQVRSPLQTENGLEYTTSVSSLEKPNSGSEKKVDTQSNISVKRMVSFIRKGGMTDPNVSRPTRRAARAPLIQEGADLSYSFSQADSAYNTNFDRTTSPEVSVGSSGKMTQINNNYRNKLNTNYTTEISMEGNSPRMKDGPKQKSSHIQTSDLIMNESSQQERVELKKDNTDLELHRTSNSPKVNDLSRRETFKSDRSSNSGPGRHSDVPSLSSEKRQAFNLHYKSDSSSSSNKSPEPSVLPLTTFSNDPEWDAIVAKSKAFDPSRGNPYHHPKKDNDKDSVLVEGMGHHPLLKKPPHDTPRENGNDDVFEKSMHPLDFAVAIRDIAEPARSTERSRDKSFGSSPRDGGLISRNREASNVTDVDGKDVDLNEYGMENTSLDVHNRTECFDSSGNSKEHGTPRRGKKPRLLGRIENRSLGSSRRMSSPMEYAAAAAPPHIETYSGLTTINVKSDGSGSRVEDVASSLRISVEVDVDQDEDYVRIDPLYRPPVDAASLNGQSELGSRPSSTGPNPSRLKAKSQIDVKPPPFDPQKPKASAASPEVRRHRIRGGGHRRMASKSSMASTGSVSYHQSSHGSSSNGGHRRPQSRRQGSNLSPMLSGRRAIPPPNDITVADPHSSLDSSLPSRPRTQSRSKSQRSNSEVSKSSSSNHSQLNHFFDMMGLDSSVLSSLQQPAPFVEAAVFQDMHTLRVGASTSSSQATGSLSEGSRVSADGVMNMKKLTKLPNQSQSIITKNARVIKWLVQCKKSQTVACR